MEKLMDDFVLKMNIRNFSKSTKTSYESELSKYLRFCEEEKNSINSASYQKYLSNLIAVKKISECSLKQSIGAVKFFLNTLSVYPTN